MSKAKFITLRYGNKVVKEEINSVSNKFLDYAVLSSLAAVGVRTVLLLASPPTGNVI